MTTYKQRLDELVKLRDAIKREAVLAITLAEELHAEVKRLEYDRQFLATAHFRSVEKLTALRTAADKMKEALVPGIRLLVSEPESKSRCAKYMIQFHYNSMEEMHAADKRYYEALSTYEQARGE